MTYLCITTHRFRISIPLITHNFKYFSLDKPQPTFNMFNFVSVSAVVATISVASAFAPATNQQRTTSLKAATGEDGLNGWVPDESAFAWGLPGALDPVGDFDPAGFATDCELGQMKQYREAETTHGRVAMLAFVGFLITEAPLEFYPLFDTGAKDIGPAIRHLDEVRATSPFFFEILAVAIGAAEFKRAVTGWASPSEVSANASGSALKSEYFPGDIGFDPLGLKPDNYEEFLIMSTKELQHGRVAMLASAGFIAQELTNGKEILVNLGVAPDDFDPSSLPFQF